MVTLPGVNVSQMLLSSLAFIQILIPRVAAALEERLKRGDSLDTILRELVNSAGETPEEMGFAHWCLALYYLAEGRNEEALKECSEARQAWPDGDPLVQFFQAHALISLRRYDQAFSAFEEGHKGLWPSFDSLEASDWLTPDYVEKSKEDFYKRWTLPGLAQGMEGLMIPDRKDWKDGAEKVAAVLRQAQKEGKEDAVWSVILQVEESQGLSPEQRGQLQEFRAFIELIAIEDPFEGLRALAESISEVWPKSVDCVEAVREQRR
jgi:tetratricopeptide (TPR) repeat protein